MASSQFAILPHPRIKCGVGSGPLPLGEWEDVGVPIGVGDDEEGIGGRRM